MSGLLLAACVLLAQGSPAPRGIGQPAPAFGIETWDRPAGEVRNVSSGGRVAPDPAAAVLGKLRGTIELADLAGLVCLVQTTAGPARKTAHALAEANRDRGTLLVLLGTEVELPELRTQLERESTPGLVGVLEATTSSPYARGATAVIGRSGELVAVSAVPKELEQAVLEALARPAALPLERPLDASLAPALEAYWTGRYGEARKHATRARERARKGGTAAALQADAEHLLARVDELETALLARADRALADSDVETLVELDLVLARGFEGASAKRADEGLRSLLAFSLHAVRLHDYRKLLELLEDRPTYFPRSDEDGGRGLAKKLVSFLRSTSNDALAQQRARGLLERYRSRFGEP